jgi:hypothetical protein
VQTCMQRERERDDAFKNIKYSAVQQNVPHTQNMVKV